ncbi:MAG: hypothetical protein KDJ19_10385 [Hyphomicrobiaceae bacterium]|nr:hypothetical protein [Hyphomicrobiaceae bacterium]MCC0024195.1 hypothetical protein [Hyphomicrobiaceae bacterium]
MKTTFKPLLTGVSLAALALTITFVPYSISFSNGELAITPAAAFAKDNERNREQNKSGSQKDDDDDDHKGGNSGSGKNSNGHDDDDDHKSGNSGSGGNSNSHDDDDDHGHMNGNSGSGSNHQMNDDDSDDDHGGGNDDDGDDDHGGNMNGNMTGIGGQSGNGPASVADFLNAMNNGASVVKAESAGGNFEVVYTGGWKEEISNGNYELKDPNGNTIAHRLATQVDIDRLNAAV